MLRHTSGLPRHEHTIMNASLADEQLYLFMLQEEEDEQPLVHHIHSSVQSCIYIGRIVFHCRMLHHSLQIARLTFLRMLRLLGVCC